jgi:uncharacterized membrane protein
MDCLNMNPNDIAPIFLLTFAAIVLLIALIAVIVKTWIYCMVFHKAGYRWAWGLLALVPIANIIIPFVLAIGDWPVRKELRLLRQQTNMSKPQGG